MADRPTPVQTIAVQQKTMPIYLTALGTVTAYNTVTIKTRVDGQLMQVNVQEGQAVKQGDLLVEIDPKPYQAALAQAEGQLARDQAQAANDQAQAARYTALFQAGVVSKESAQTQQASAGQSAGLLKSDQAAIQAAKVNLSYTRITSPINGVIGLRQVDAGNIVHASDSTGLLVITQLQPIAVIFTLPEDHLPDVLKLTRGGQKLAVDAYDRSGAEGRVRQQGWSAVPEPVCECATDPAGAAECDCNSFRCVADGVAGELCVRREAGRSAGGPAGSRREPEQAGAQWRHS